MQVYVAHAGNMDKSEEFLIAFRGPEHVDFESSKEFFADDGAKVGRLLAWLTAEIWGDSFIRGFSQGQAEVYSGTNNIDNLADFLGEPVPTALLEIRTTCQSTIEAVEVKGTGVVADAM